MTDVTATLPKSFVVRKPAAPRTRPAPRPRPDAPRRDEQAPRRAARPARTSRKLPAWSDLAAGDALPGRAPAAGGVLERISTLRFALLIVVLASAFIVYEAHLYATEQLLTEVQQLRRDNHRLHLKYNRLKGEFDRMTSPASIYGRAAALGLEESHVYVPTIYAD